MSQAAWGGNYSIARYGSLVAGFSGRKLLISFMMLATRPRALGVHTSIAGGIHFSLERAAELGCSTMQIFSHNPRQWLVRNIPEEEVSQFRKLRRKYRIAPVYVHSSYLINLCSLSAWIVDKSVRLLVREMELADMIGAEYVVLHTGSAYGDNAGNARSRAARALGSALSYRKWKARLLLENTAGERGNISSSIRDLSEIMEGTGGAQIGGICIDTCHAFQAGYEISGVTGVSDLVKEITESIGPDKVKLIHLNDSRRPFNARVDRHEHIGQGSIGTKGLKYFVNHPAFRTVPLILETPKNSEDDDPRNLRIARSLLSPP